MAIKLVIFFAGQPTRALLFRLRDGHTQARRVSRLRSDGLPVIDLLKSA